VLDIEQNGKSSGRRDVLRLQTDAPQSQRLPRNEIAKSLGRCDVLRLQADAP